MSPKIRGIGRLAGASSSAALASGLIALASCSSSEAPNYITLTLRTDLTIGEELDHVRVDVLRPFDETVVDRGWLKVDTTCQFGSPEDRPLGTLQVETGTARSVRVRASGFVAGPDGQLQSVVDTQLLVPAVGKQTFDLFLPRACAGYACSVSTTCSAKSGKCVALPTAEIASAARSEAHCASLLRDAPPVDVATPASILRCTREDGLCVAGQGQPCGALATCAAGFVCAQGVCCASDCDGVCERCDVVGQAGECTPVDFSSSDDAQHCGACRAACGSESAFGASCVEGRCDYQCRNGFADCNATSGAHDGCERPIAADASNCGGCGVMCEFPFCHDQTCAEIAGQFSAQGQQRLETGVSWGVPIALQKTYNLVGLGAALRNTSQPPARVRFALYEADAYGEPRGLVGQTVPVDVLDFSDQTLRIGAQLTYAEVAPTLLLPNNYWIVLESDKPIDVMSESLVERRLEAPSTGVEIFPPMLDGSRRISAGADVLLDIVAFVVEVHES